MAEEQTEQLILQQAEQFREDYQKVRQQVAKMIVGHNEIIDGVLTCMFVGGHALLEGVPGLGKTLLVRTLAESLSLELQPHPVHPRPDARGHHRHDHRRGRPQEDGTPAASSSSSAARSLRKSFWPTKSTAPRPRPKSAMLEAMQENSVTVGGTTHPMAKPFFVLATQNPIEQEGTYPLPEAQLDRFLFKLDVGYSSREDLHEILNRTTRPKSRISKPCSMAKRSTSTRSWCGRC